MDVDQVTSEMREDEARAANAYSKKFFEIWQGRQAATGKPVLGSLADIEKLAERLPKRRSSANIFLEYHQADEKLGKIEELLGEAVASYDEYVDGQIHGL